MPPRSVSAEDKAAKAFEELGSVFASLRESPLLKASSSKELLSGLSPAQLKELLLTLNPELKAAAVAKWGEAKLASEVLKLVPETERLIAFLSPEQLASVVRKDFEGLAKLLDAEFVSSMFGRAGLPASELARSPKTYFMRKLFLRVTEQYQAALADYLTQVDDVLKKASKISLSSYNLAGMRKAFYTAFSDTYSRGAELSAKHFSKGFLAEAKANIKPKTVGLSRTVTVGGTKVDVTPKVLEQWAKDMEEGLKRGGILPEWYVNLEDKGWKLLFEKHWSNGLIEVRKLLNASNALQLAARTESLLRTPIIDGVRSAVSSVKSVYSISKEVGVMRYARSQLFIQAADKAIELEARSFTAKLVRSRWAKTAVVGVAVWQLAPAVWGWLGSTYDAVFNSPSPAPVQKPAPQRQEAPVQKTEAPNAGSQSVQATGQDSVSLVSKLAGDAGVSAAFPGMQRNVFLHSVNKVAGGSSDFAVFEGGVEKEAALKNHEADLAAQGLVVKTLGNGFLLLVSAEKAGNTLAALEAVSEALVRVPDAKRRSEIFLKIAEVSNSGGVLLLQFGEGSGLYNNSKALLDLGLDIRMEGNSYIVTHKKD